MDVYERKQKILEILNQKGKVSVHELSKLFDISEVTIRIDLADLETQGLLSRIHGGAVSSYKTYHNMGLWQRLAENQEKKQAIAKKTVEMIDENDTVFFNSGTTTLTVFRMLPPKLNLSIVTNSVTIALEGSNNPNFNIVLLGGHVNSKYQFIYGDDANAQLQKYHADKLILSVDGISLTSGLTTYYNHESEIDRLMIANSSTRIIAADNTKIDRVAFTKISGVEDIDYIITNKDSSTDDALSELREVTGKIITV